MKKTERWLKGCFRCSSGKLEKEGVDALVIIGGDGTLTSARDFARKGVNVIGVPKTIDNDLAATDVTFDLILQLKLLQKPWIDYILQLNLITELCSAKLWEEMLVG